jgi:hypothetical protein
LLGFNQPGAGLDHLADIVTAVACDLDFVSGVFAVVRAILLVGHAPARRVSAFLSVSHSVSSPCLSPEGSNLFQKKKVTPRTPFVGTRRRRAAEH